VAVQTLQQIALVHEGCLKLVGPNPGRVWKDRRRQQPDAENLATPALNENVTLNALPCCDAQGSVE
jgi:hypothetical protein